MRDVFFGSVALAGLVTVAVGVGWYSFGAGLIVGGLLLALLSLVVWQIAGEE